jgi:mycoredoxin
VADPQQCGIWTAVPAVRFWAAWFWAAWFWAAQVRRCSSGAVWFTGLVVVRWRGTFAGMRRWGLSIAVLVSGVVLAGGLLARSSPVPAAVVLVISAVVAVLVSPRAFPASVSAGEAQRRSGQDGRPIVYWRPGCPFCMRLRAALGRDAGRLHWVDIWSDPAGAAAVRAVADGNETVPTVIIRGVGHVNPSPAWVRKQLTSTH